MTGIIESLMYKIPYQKIDILYGVINLAGVAFIAKPEFLFGV